MFDRAILALLYALIPVPGLLYLAIAVYLRERKHTHSPDRNLFAVVNGVAVMTTLGVFIGTLPGFAYLLNFVAYMSSSFGPRPKPIVSISLLAGGILICGIGFCALSYRHRFLFQKYRVPYYLAALIVCVPLVSMEYLLADAVDFHLHHR